eukprot:8847403-Pyramimonas_sp.AAC.1
MESGAEEEKKGRKRGTDEEEEREDNSFGSNYEANEETCFVDSKPCENTKLCMPTATEFLWLFSTFINQLNSQGFELPAWEFL